VHALQNDSHDHDSGYILIILAVLICIGIKTNNIGNRIVVMLYCIRRFNSCNKAGQTEFTVYRHRLFDFACGRAVIFHISN
jgi:hypothetical protein